RGAAPPRARPGSSWAASPELRLQQAVVDLAIRQPGEGLDGADVEGVGPGVQAGGQVPCGGATGGVVRLDEEDGDPVVARHDGSPGRGRQPPLDVVEVDPHPEYLAHPLQPPGDVEEA